MTTLNMKREADAKPAEFPRKPPAAADGSVQGQVRVQCQVQGPVQGPMSQQSAFGSHGYDIHPQKFVRLVGCHPSNAAKCDATRPLQRTAA
jgi:hypothetical protein